MMGKTNIRTSKLKFYKFHPIVLTIFLMYSSFSTKIVIIYGANQL